MKHLVKFWLPVLIYLILIFVLSSSPKPVFSETEVPFFDEFHQHFVPNRIASLGDVFFDCIGSVIGSIVYREKI